jgi:hypothetical protein
MTQPPTTVLRVRTAGQIYRVPVIFHMLGHLDLRFSDIATLPVLLAIVVPNLRTLRLAFLGIGLTRMFVSMFRHNISQVTMLDLDWHHNMSRDIVVLLIIFPNLTSLDLSHCRNRVTQEATNGLASPELHLPNLERIRVGWFVSEHKAKQILQPGSRRIAANCVMVSMIPGHTRPSFRDRILMDDTLYYTRILSDNTLYIVVD